MFHGIEAGASCDKSYRRVVVPRLTFDRVSCFIFLLQSPGLDFSFFLFCAVRRLRGKRSINFNGVYVLTMRTFVLSSDMDMGDVIERCWCMCFAEQRVQVVEPVPVTATFNLLSHIRIAKSLLSPSSASFWFRFFCF